jgi:hypothetical protein
VGGILGTALLFLIGIVIFLLRRRKTRVDQTPAFPASGYDANKPGEFEGGGLSKGEMGENVGGRLRYDGVLNEEGILQSDD